MFVTAKPLAALLTLVIAAIVVTPLCGALFACGCAWPQAGFYFDCNYFRPEASHRCPWCVSFVWGGLWTGISILCGTAAALIPRRRIFRRAGWECCARVGSGLLVFMCSALLAAWFAVYSQHYPGGPIGAAAEVVRAVRD